MGAIEVEWRVGKGLAGVLESFRSVEKAQKQLERSVQSGATSMVRSQESAGRAARRAGETSNAALTKSVEREAARQNAVRERSAAMAGRLASKQAAEEVRIREAAERQKLAIQRNSALMAGRIAESQARQEEALRKRFTGGVAASVTRSAGNALGGMAKVAGGILALGGGFSAADAVQQTVANAGKASELSIQSGGQVSKADALSKAQRTAEEFGTTTQDVLAAFDAFGAKSGDYKAGFSLMREMVELATATGADLGELARTAGIVQNTTGNSADTMAVMREMAGMGRAGSVDMRELAQYASRVTAGSSLFANKRGAITALGAFTQQAAATGGATGAAEATEAVAHFGSDIYKHEDAFKALGITTRDATDKTHLAAPLDIIKSALSKTGGDHGQMLALFGDRSVKSVTGYEEAYNRAGGGKAGLDAVDAMFKNFASAALKEEQVRAEAAKRLQDEDKRLTAAFEKLRNAVGNELVPELVKLIPVLRDAIPSFVKLLQAAEGFAEWFSDNPIKGVGAIILANVTKDLAAAGIGEAVKRAIMFTLAGASPVAGPSGLAAGTGLLAAGGAALAGGVIGAGVGYGIVEHDSAAQLGAQKGAVGGALSLSNELANTKDPRKLRELQDRIQAKIAETERARNNAGPGYVAQAVGGLTGNTELVDAARTEQAAYNTVIKSLREDLKQLSEAIKVASKTQTDWNEPWFERSSPMASRDGTQ